MRPFEHVDATSVSDAIALLKAEPDGTIIAGGTDLLDLMKDGLASPRVLINVKTIDGLDRIEADAAGHLIIGPITTLARLAEDARVRQDFLLLSEAISVTASPQLRNMATVAGNVCQRPRCWYYRGTFDCFLKGGNSCLAVGGRSRDSGIFGAAECAAVNPSDLAPALLALGASVVIENAKRRREVPLESFFTAPQKDRPGFTVLGRDEMIVEVKVPKQPVGSRGIYLKAMERKTWSFAQASAAIQLSRAEARVTDVRIILGGVAPVPWRASAAEDVLRGKVPTGELIERVAATATDGAHPLGQNGYKVKLAKALVKRGLAMLVDNSRS
ncbi:MAG: xanthine dehydrogenase family protein subunit M [Chloroflexi bacterium]|nr:xanthine dehydrogenase family protein subunit M [Chloroflexota bacterium]